MNTLFCFVPVSPGMYVNLAHVRRVHVCSGKTNDDPAKTETVVVLDTDKQAVLSRGEFAEGVLRAIGAEAHTLLPATTK